MRPASPEPLTLSLSEAAKVLSIGVSTAYRLCSRADGDIDAVTVESGRS